MFVERADVLELDAWDGKVGNVPQVLEEIFVVHFLV